VFHADDIARNADVYVKEGRLYIDKGAPFSKLFPLMDVIVTHGGLGSTGKLHDTF